jgi:hypothetical protein
MAYSQAHDVLDMLVAHKVGSNRLTLPLVRGIMTELSTHPAECKCGCAWMTQTDAGKVMRNALYWQRQFAAAARLARR